MRGATSELEFRWCPFWVQVHGLPVDKMTTSHGETIGNRIGRLIEVKARSEGLLLERSFLRLRVDVDVTKPLLQGFILHRRGALRVEIDDVRVLYKYEKLSEFCYNCRQIGHDNLSCKFVSREKGVNFRYGPSMRTERARTSGLFMILLAVKLLEWLNVVTILLSGRLRALCEPSGGGGCFYRP
ncbi:hypothetical protein ACSBR2_005057 [Camellia fascicularis]